MFCDLIVKLHQVFSRAAQISQRMTCCLCMISAHNGSCLQAQPLQKSGAGTDTLNVSFCIAHQSCIMVLKGKEMLKHCWCRTAVLAHSTARIGPHSCIAAL